MITSPAFKGKRFAVLGLARSGAAAAEALLASGAEVIAWDRQPHAREPFEGRCRLIDPLELDLTGFAGVVVSPGVPLNSHPIGPHTWQYGLPVIGDIELFAMARASLPPHRVVGITGTNGKSTTTALVHHILREAGVPTVMGGNIGDPVLGQDPLPEGGVYVLELSSFQIDLTFTLDCDVAALTNITPDHLDRYASFEAYAAAKERLFQMQQTGTAIICDEDEPTTAIAEGLETAGKPLVRVKTADLETAGLAEGRSPSLAGPHNAQNAAVAAAICRQLGLTDAQIAAGLASYRGLPHRMERVCEVEGVTYINDSKATNAASAAPALAAFPPDPAINGGSPRIHWIVGGLPKEDGLGACADHLANIAAAYTVGEAGPMFADLLEGQVRVERCELISEAVRRAVEAARPGEIVLLSPACASYDQFRDYEKRGHHFRQMVGAITGCDTCLDDASARSILP
ncbi:UDP-N-acetylmuramoyl-L-alanine--D-glutamate ligase [Porphyrobacter sp. CACIAM 03H1]|uniref:UDP-N-acetylmuramoyl-L-alanine--D-glutamate ligase n=1 Tax=Porphyrobacter sp. CACIAM 03H1 TaxID=2003315 RepID=UPI000B5A73FD|nr:UDP-N-acetylmuramoyl-L-alanine--D-glutamate ligase [Porphyrobacter sp. CACIAM 03H1]ASJ90620.1 UDP-N-acetylmuramoyl-L-alanine--D-glutamate ligase [Porphyrobacter sp. CACIAM 03H1]